MSDGAEKLRALARQSRMLSRETWDRERARSLRSLADLYEEQAADLEFALLALEAVPLMTGEASSAALPRRFSSVSASSSRAS